MDITEGKKALKNHRRLCDDEREYSEMLSLELEYVDNHYQYSAVVVDDKAGKRCVYHIDLEKLRYVGDVYG